MCKKLAEAGVDILAMGYYKNENARSGEFKPGHENAVAYVLEQNGFQCFTQKDVPQLKKGHLKEWWENGFGDDLDELLADLPKGCFVLQPGGSQSFPDIIVKDFEGRWVALECKSGKDYCPMWNDNTPKPGAAYIMSSGKLNETTMFMGDDVITPEQQKIINEGIEQLAKLAESISDKVKELDEHNRGFILSSRRQFFQQGGKEKTNYFTHSDRKDCEQKVLEFLAR